MRLTDIGDICVSTRGLGLVFTAIGEVCIADRGDAAVGEAAVALRGLAIASSLLSYEIVL